MAINVVGKNTAHKFVKNSYRFLIGDHELHVLVTSQATLFLRRGSFMLSTM